MIYKATIKNYFINKKLFKMKKIGKLKLNQVTKNSLCNEELISLKGGYEGYDCCACGCNGPSSWFDNMNANSAAGYGDTMGGAWTCFDWIDPDHYYSITDCS